MEELFTKENKTQFEEWGRVYFRKHGKFTDHMVFYKYLQYLPFEFQIGVRLAYADSLKGILIEVTAVVTDNGLEWKYHVYKNLVRKNKRNIFFKTRNEAYKAAFKKFDELINSKTD